MRIGLDRVGLACGVGLLAACGGAAERAPRAPDVRSESEPRDQEKEPMTIEEAQARITRARSVLAGNGGPALGATSAPAPAEPSAPAKAARPPASTPAPEATGSESAVTQKAEDRCASPCRALVSMRHAVTALCRMTGAEDARCVEAKKTLSDSETRVVPCSC